jgi:hypothetical protein
MGPKTNPTINKKLSVLFCFETRVSFTMPLTPANRPLPIKNNITAKPIIMPPAKADRGVKFMTFINLIHYRLSVWWAKKKAHQFQGK